MTNNDNSQEEFDNLPFEWQMRILQMRKNMEEMMPHIEEITNDLANHILFFDEVENAIDAKELNAKLFCAAEKADKEKSYADHTKLCHEWTKEYDWIRHVLNPRKISIEPEILMNIQVSDDKLVNPIEHIVHTAKISY